MALIYDNIETKFAEGLQGIITNDRVKRVDFCVGYFNNLPFITFLPKRSSTLSSTTISSTLWATN